MKYEIKCHILSALLFVSFAVVVGFFMGQCLCKEETVPSANDIDLTVAACDASFKTCQQQLLTLSALVRTLPPEATLADLSRRLHLFMRVQADSLEGLDGTGVDASKLDETFGIWEDASTRLLRMAGLEPNAAVEFTMPPGRPGAVFIGLPPSDLEEISR